MARTKGSRNKRTFEVEEIASRYKLQPFEFAMTVLNNDWEALGFEGATKITYTAAGIEVVESNIKLSERIECAKFAGKFLYSPKQPMDPATGDAGITIKIVDYTKAK